MTDETSKAQRAAAMIRNRMKQVSEAREKEDRFKSIVYVGDHEGNIYDPYAVGIIFARKWNPRSGEFENSRIRVEIPEQYRIGVVWYYSEQIEVQTDRETPLFLRKIEY